MKKKDVLTDLNVTTVGDDTVFIRNAHFNFAFTIADKIVKPELVGKHRYFGGLQCSYHKDTENYKNLEGWLCEIAETLIKFCN